MRRSGFLTFCFAFCPGAGQMYQGYMKRGISIMGAFGLSIALTSMFGTVLFPMLIVIVWFAAFFDTFNIARRDEAARRAQPDDWLWNSVDWGGRLANPSQQRVLGIVCLILGAWLLLEQLPRLLNNLGIDVYGIVNFIERYVPSVALALALIWLGMRFLSGRGAGRQAPYRPVAPPPPPKEDDPRFHAPVPGPIPTKIPRPQPRASTVVPPNATVRPMAAPTARPVTAAAPAAPADPAAAGRAGASAAAGQASATAAKAATTPSLELTGAQDPAAPKAPVTPQLVLETEAPATSETPAAQQDSTAQQDAGAN